MITQWSRWPAIFTYVQATWLDSKEKFVKYWTNKVMHFGNIVNCRVESQHSALKCWIERSTGSLDTVWAEVVYYRYTIEAVLRVQLRSYYLLMLVGHTSFDCC